jgi:RecQ-mediated genome instability protein 1
LLNELQLDQGSQWDELAKQVELQLLQSDLADSMQRQTGFPASIHNMKNGVIGTRASGGGILVQINAITEIGASAFTLKNVRQARMDKADMTGLTKDKIDTEAGEDQVNSTAREVDEEDVTMPSYPRSMLSLMVTDGNLQIKAIEYKKINDLKLGETPLGCKVCVFH